MRPTASQIKPLILLATIAASSCAIVERPEQHTPSPAVIPNVEPPEIRSEDELIDVELDRFCGHLAKIVASETEGFVRLRGGEIDRRRWQASVVPEGLFDCFIEGPRRPIAIYDCRSQPLAGSHQGLLDRQFDDKAQDLDACLSHASWYPLEWRRGRIIEFGRGEKQITWREITSSPRPVVSLHIEEDFSRRIHYLRLAVGTLN